MGEPARERVIVTAPRPQSRSRHPPLPVLIAAAAVVLTAAVALGPSHSIYAGEHDAPPVSKKQGALSAGDQTAGDQTAVDRNPAGAKAVKPPASSGPKPLSGPDPGVPVDATPAPGKVLKSEGLKSTVPAVSREMLRSLEIDELSRRGESAAKNAQQGLAELFFREVLRRRPSHFPANLFLGRLLSKKSPRMAYRRLETARRINPRSPSVHFYLGAVLESMKRDLAAADS